jgi:alkanesulfonate monooxygenase SsuD/methylene tetrahydromethanopterin reductase-like flavin-dependent oxidoreductase (luciferase family)
VAHGTAPTADLLEQLLREATLGDELGYHSYFVIEHRNSHISHITSPSVYLAPVAQRTRRLRLGAMLYVFPFHATRARGGAARPSMWTARQRKMRDLPAGLAAAWLSWPDAAHVLDALCARGGDRCPSRSGAKEHLLTARDGGNWLHKTRVGFKGVQETPTTRELQRVFQGMRSSYECWIDNGLALVGSPETVIKRIQGQQARVGHDLLCTNHRFGGISTALVVDSMTLFGREVIPAFEG